MLKHTKALPLVVALALAPAAFAQTSSTPAPAGSPDLGQPVGAAATNAIGTPYSAGTSGDWEERCVRAPGGHDPCQLYQLLKDSNGNSVAEFAISALAPGQVAVAGATVVTPLETLLPRGVTLQIDSLPAKVYSYLFCAPQGCIANVGFTADELAAMKKGQKILLDVASVQSPDQPVQLTISLKGFSQGLDAVSKLNKEHGVNPGAASAAPPAADQKPRLPGVGPAAKN